MEKKIVEEKENMKVQQAAFDKFSQGSRRAALFFLPAMCKACKYTYLEKDDRVKSSQVTSDILSWNILLYLIM